MPPTINRKLLAYAMATSMGKVSLATAYVGHWKAIGQLPPDPELLRYTFTCGADVDE